MADAPEPLTRRDMVLLRRAARNRWGVPDALQTDALMALHGILANPLAEDKVRLAAVRTLEMFTRSDQRDDHHADKHALDLAKFAHATKPPEAPTDRDFTVDLAPPDADDPPHQGDRPPA